MFAAILLASSMVSTWAVSASAFVSPAIDVSKRLAGRVLRETRAAIDAVIELERQLCRSIDLDVFADRVTIDYLLDQLHDMAKISAPRLEIPWRSPFE
jgi:hypothetical protein